MKHLLLLSLLVVFLVMPYVHAGLDITGGTTQLSFGGSDQHKQDTFTRTFKVNNTFLDADNITLKNFKQHFTVKNNFHDANVQIAVSPDTLTTANPEATVTVTVIPGDFDAVNKDLQKRGPVNIGSLTVDADKIDTVTQQPLPDKATTTAISLSLEIRNDLDITSVELVKDTTTKTIGDGATMTITVNDDYDLKFKIKNLFGSSSSISLENVNIKVTSNDLNIDKSATISEIQADKETEKSISVSVDQAATGDVTVEVQGTDKYGGKHGKVFSFRFRAEDAQQETDPSKIDSDGDGVPDSIDTCPNTVSQCTVDTSGCPIDSDHDGTCDALDPTPFPKNNPAAKPQDNSNSRLPSQSGENDQIAKDTKKETKNDTTATDDGTSGFIPFLIGFAIGILVTAGFSVLIKS